MKISYKGLFIPFFITILIIMPKLSAKSAGSDVLLRIIGSGGPGYNSQRAESSVLLRYGDVTFLIDMGNGTQAGLNTANIKLRQLSALFITHHHTDHEQEFIPILAGMLMGKTASFVVGPSGIRSLTEFTENFYKSDILYRRSNIGMSGDIPVTDVREVKGGEEFSVRGVTIRTAAVNHSIETIAYRFEKDGKSIVVSGDLYYSESLILLSKNADILILDGGPLSSSANGATNSKKKKGTDRQRAHSTLDEIVSMVVSSQAKSVVLTHLPSRTIDEDSVRAAFIRAGAGCMVIFARDGLEI